MTVLIQVHPKNPQARLIQQAIGIIQQGGIAVFPTDSAYALGCQLGNKEAIERIQSLRELDKNHNFTLMCKDLSELGTYARVDNSLFRLIKASTPGPYTFILPATHEVPRRLQHPKRKTIGLRIPDHPVTQLLLEMLAEPLMSVTLILPPDSLPLSDPEEIYQRINKRVDVFIDAGSCGLEATTVVDMVAGSPKIIREGKGDPSAFL
jgi:tRNA threonylcarbamoyl adenosine modification protein (Sua5/YciO/YrdC/YwlC family)